MKRYVFAALCLVLTAALLVGCGCTKQKTDDKSTSAPTVLPTNEEVWDNTTEPTTRATVPPTTGATEPSATIDRGNGALEDTTDAATATDETGTTTATEGTVTGRARRAMPNTN